jgi:hypothetical protein
LTALELVGKARTNWRSSLWVVVAVGTFALAIGVSAYARNGVAPGEAEQTARRFIVDWNKGDYRGAYSFLTTSVTSDDFVSAMTQTAAPLRDARVERVAQTDDRHATIDYSVSLPDAISAAAGVVVANPDRYAGTCVAANLRGARYVRVTDKLVVDRLGDGTWKIAFRGNQASSGTNAAAIGLAMDLRPQSVFARVGQGTPRGSAAFDNQLISQTLAIYQADAGALPTEDPGDSSPDDARIRVTGVGQACRTGT